MLKKVLVLFVFVFLLMPVFAFGQLCGDLNLDQPPCSTLGVLGTDSKVGEQAYVDGTPMSYDTERMISAVLMIVNWLSWFVGLVAVIIGLYSGFLFITARDNANQITTARNTMMYAIIGIGVAIIAFSLVSISRSLLGL